MVRSLVALAVLASGCHALLGIEDFHTADAGTDAAVDDADGAPLADAQLCFGTFVPVCRTSPPNGTVIIAGAINTNSDPRCETVTQAGGAAMCVIPSGTMSIENTVVTGQRPLVLLAAGVITVNGALDVSSTHGGQLGAAASSMPCATAQNGMPGEAGGGAGGSFGTIGGAGANGGPGGSSSAGGMAAATITPTAIRGGCAGGLGGKGGGPSEGAIGPSGGALALYAGSSINIIAAGSIYASGAGGGGGGANSGTKGGGGGGGSGGLIVLDAPAIQVLGVVAANGGGGGGGNDGGSGQPGADGTTAMYATAAAGGAPSGLMAGGRGGVGAGGATAAAAGLSPTGGGGGGGGGGGAGIIWIHGALTGSNKLSPAPQQH